MNYLKTIFISIISMTFLFSSAMAADDIDWLVSHEAVTESGPGTPIVGKRWSMGTIKNDLMFNIHLDAAPDMLMGNWYGDIRSTERFYIKTFLLDTAGKKYNLKLNDIKAYGPDAEYGVWKKGAATTSIQALRFDFTREEILALKPFKSLVVNYGPFESPNDTTDIIFDLTNYTQRLAELDASIKNAGGDAFLLTDEDINNMPINDLPAVHKNKWIDGVADISSELSVPFSELMKLSINQITEKVEAKKDANREAVKAAKRAEHQAIYDQKPDWKDLNVCPKPDVSECRNIGRMGYEKDNMFNKEYDYGKIIGVVWRSEGSIVHIYGGRIDYDLDPEIVRAKSAKYYYVLENDKGYLELRSAKNILLR